jgi:hypothetical protein
MGPSIRSLCVSAFNVKSDHWRSADPKLLNSPTQRPCQGPRSRTIHGGNYTLLAASGSPAKWSDLGGPEYASRVHAPPAVAKRLPLLNSDCPQLTNSE